MNNKYKNKIIFFGDILGFKNATKTNNENVHTTVEMLETIFNNSIENKKTHIQDRNGFYDNISDYKLLIMSDSIVITYPKTINLEYILEHLLYIQLEIFKKGFLLRGIITIGNIYDDKNFYGPGLIKATKLKSEIAKSPSIILDRQFIELLDPINYKLICKQKILLKNKGEKYEEQIFFLDYLTEESFNINSVFNNQHYTYYSDTPYVYLELLKLIKKIIEVGLIQYEKEDKIHDKYIWLKNYYNNNLLNDNKFPSLKNKEEFIIKGN